MWFRLIVVLAVVAAPRVAGAVDVTTCEQVIEAGEVAELRQDLACARRPIWPFSALGVYLEPGATLVMNGFTIAGDGSGVGVNCYGSRRCTIQGPGEIRGFELGVNCGGCRLVARDVAFRDNVSGILIPKSGILDAERVVASDNAEFGIWAHRLRATDVEAERNGWAGIAANASLRLRRVVVTGNGYDGVRCLGFRCGRTRIADSTVTGNATSGSGYYDIASTGPVRLRDVTCDRSAKLFYPGWRDGDYETVEVVGSFGCVED
jgi:hypothetical protein